MFLLFYLLFPFFEVYTLIFIIFILAQIVRRKKLPWTILISEILCLALFFYLKFLVGEHKLIFIGEYVDGTKDWGSGLSNVGTYTFNLAILAGLFLIMQVIFWIIFSRRFKKLNYPDLGEKALTELLNSQDEQN